MEACDKPRDVCFIGILLCVDANNSNTDHTTEIWKSSSFFLYAAVIGLKRFWNILCFIRFDNFNTCACSRT